MNAWVTILNTTINILPIKQIYVCCFVKCKNGCLEISNRMANMGLHALWQGQYGSKCGFAKQYVWHHITSHHSKYISPYSQYPLESQPQTSYVIEKKISRLIHKAPVLMRPRPFQLPRVIIYESVQLVLFVIADTQRSRVNTDKLRRRPVARCYSQSYQCLNYEHS